MKNHLARKRAAAGNQSGPRRARPCAPGVRQGRKKGTTRVPAQQNKPKAAEAGRRTHPGQRQHEQPPWRKLSACRVDTHVNACARRTASYPNQPRHTCVPPRKGEQKAHTFLKPAQIRSNPAKTDPRRGVRIRLFSRFAPPITLLFLFRDKREGLRSGACFAAGRRRPPARGHGHGGTSYP